MLLDVRTLTEWSACSTTFFGFFARSIIFPLFGLAVPRDTGTYIGKSATFLHRVIGRILSLSGAFLLHPMLWHCLLPEIAPCGFRMDGYTALYLCSDTVVDPYTISASIPTPVRAIRLASCDLHYSSIVSEHDLNMVGNLSVFLLSNKPSTVWLYSIVWLISMYVSPLLSTCTLLYG